LPSRNALPIYTIAIATFASVFNFDRKKISSLAAAIFSLNLANLKNCLKKSKISFNYIKCVRQEAIQCQQLDLMHTTWLSKYGKITGGFDYEEAMKLVE
jgi:hypothetical protein